MFVSPNTSLQVRVEQLRKLFASMMWADCWWKVTVAWVKLERTEAEIMVMSSASQQASYYCCIVAMLPGTFPALLMQVLKRNHVNCTQGCFSVMWQCYTPGKEAVTKLCSGDGVHAFHHKPSVRKVQCVMPYTWLKGFGRCSSICFNCRRVCKAAV